MIGTAQVDGSHYAADFQHWDFAIEARLPFLIGVATKYMFRAHRKHGLIDAQKCATFVAKWAAVGHRHYEIDSAAPHRLPEHVVLRMAELGLLQVGAPPVQCEAVRYIIKMMYNSFHTTAAQNAVEMVIKEYTDGSLQATAGVGKPGGNR